MLSQHRHIVARVLDEPLAGDCGAGCNGFDIVSQGLAEFGKFLMFGFDTFESFSHLRFFGFHHSIEQVFLRVMYGIGVDGHVAHDVMDQLVVGPLSVAYVLNLLAKQVQHDRHIAVVCTKIVKKVCE